MKKWFIAGGIMIFVGLVLFGIVMVKNDLSFKNPDKGLYISRDTKFPPFTNIKIESDTDDIRIVYNDGKATEVLTPIRERLRYDVTVEGDTLVIRMDDQRKWYDYISIFGDPGTITLSLSERDYENLYISADTSDVSVDENFTFGSADIAVSTGRIEYYPVTIGDVSLSATTGSVYVNCKMVSNITVKVSTGDISLENLTCNGDLTLTSSTGDAKLTNVQCLNMFTKGTTGKFTINSGCVIGKLTVKRSTGDVILNGFKAGEIEIETDTGDVTGTLLENMEFHTKTSTGSVNVPHSIAGNLCKITTSTGDIQFTISQN